MTSSATGNKSSTAACRRPTIQSMRASGRARRKAAAIGTVCTMSPIALNRTRSTFTGCGAEGIGGLAGQPRQQIARRVVLGVADDGGAAAIGQHDRAFGNGLDRVVRALAVHVGFQTGQQVADRVVVEHHDVVDPAQRRHQFGARLLVQDGTALAFQPPHRRIAVDGDHQPVGFGGGGLQIADVPDVQEIEDPVGKRDRAARRTVGPQRLFDVGQGQDRHVQIRLHLWGRASALQSRSMMAARSSSAETVAVPRFITTRPPA